MALITCPECGKQISDKSKQCIHCGYPISEGELEQLTSRDQKEEKELEKLTPGNQEAEEKEAVPTQEAPENNSNDVSEDKIEPEDNAEQEADSVSKSEPTAEVPKKKGKTGIIIAAVAVVCVCAAVGGYFATANSRAYKSAMSLETNGQYEEAITAFTNLGDYEDSSEQIKECTYQLGLQELKGSNYTEAINYFNEITDYQDSAEQIKECTYQLGLQQLKSSNYTEAINYFSEIPDYQDSAEQIKVCKYAQAQVYFNSGDYENAESYYEELGDYENSEELLSTCKYKLSTDGKFMDAVAAGLNARWKLADDDSFNDSTTDGLKTLINCELDAIKEFKDQTFENEELGKLAQNYIGYLEQSEEALSYYNVDYSKYDKEWTEAYNNRSVAIKSFYEDYGLKVDDAYKTTLEDFLSTATAVNKKSAYEKQITSMLSDIKLELKSNEYGYRTYKATVKNTTDVTFNYITVEAKVYDSDGVLVDTVYGDSLNDFKPGDTAKVEFFTDTKIDKYEITADYDYDYE